MSGIATAVVGGAVVSSLIAADAAGDAADAQAGASQASIQAQKEQQAEAQELLSPFTEAGVRAIAAQEGLLGLSGAEEQEQAIAALEGSPQFQTLVQQGEEALLQNAAATGGIRGGNLQGALAQFRPQILSGLIESQFGKLGQVAGLGQASAAGEASVGQQTTAGIQQALTQQGQAQAGSALAQGQAFGNIASNVGSGIGTAIALGGF